MTQFLGEVPEGLREVKTYTSGQRLVVCEHRRLRLYKDEYHCVDCRFSATSANPERDPSRWRPVKLLVRVYGKYAEYRNVETKKIRFWLRHWKKQLERGVGDLVYDPEFEVKKLTEELVARGVRV